MQGRFTDKILICVDCKEEFVFPASAQEYFNEKGYKDDPRRCRSCHKVATNRSPRHRSGQGTPSTVGVAEGDDDEGNEDGDEDGECGFACLVLRWPPTGYPPRHLTDGYLPPRSPGDDPASSQITT